MREELIPDAGAILGWIEQVFERGVRRPGYPADRWVEQFAVERFRAFGLERVRLEPVSLPCWEPHSCSLHVEGAGAALDLPCFPLPHTASTQGLELELAAFDPARPDRVAGRAALDEVRLLRTAPASPLGLARARGLPRAERVIDPRDSFEGAEQVLPFGPRFQAVMEPALAAGAAAYIGALRGYPGDSYQYYVPYDAVARPIPGVWIRGSDGARLHALLAQGSVRVRLRVDAQRRAITSHNVVGELPGASPEWVVIGSHHDGPWSSAVEDGSGVALVLAQAAYWSRVPRAERPHRLVFLLNAGHMAGGAGCAAFLRDHADELDRIVLSLHLEHAAREFAERDGALAATGEPEPRWFFTSCVPRLERAVASLLREEKLDRSLILPPDVFGPHPTTDGGLFHPAGVPLVDYLTAPFYLFDPMDAMDKIDVASLLPVTRFAARLVEWTGGVRAAGLRAESLD